MNYSCIFNLKIYILKNIPKANYFFRNVRWSWLKRKSWEMVFSGGATAWRGALTPAGRYGDAQQRPGLPAARAQGDGGKNCGRVSGSSGLVSADSGLGTVRRPGNSGRMNSPRNANVTPLFGGCWTSDHTAAERGAGVRAGCQLAIEKPEQCA